MLFCIKGHHNFFHKIAFFPKGISVLQTCPGTMKIGRNSQAIQLRDVGFIWWKKPLRFSQKKKTIPKFKVSRRVHLMCQIYSSLLVKNCWTHQSVQKHFLLIRCWIPQLKSRNSHKGQWGSKSVVFESVHWFLDSTLFWNRYLVLLQTWMFFKEYCETYYKFMFKRWFVCTQKILSQSINSISRIRRPVKRNSKWCQIMNCRCQEMLQHHFE